MKRKFAFLSLVLVLAVAVLAACGNDDEGGAGVEGARTFPGRIAVITNTLDQNEEEYRSGQQIVAKYGSDNIVHVTWPANFMAEQEQMVTTVQQLAADPEIRAIIINQAVPGSIPAIDRLLDDRDDIFIMFASPQEDVPAVSQRAHLTINMDMPGVGTVLARQIYDMGATHIVHYSFPRHMSIPLIAARHANLRAGAEALGLTFIDVTSPDPTGEGGVPATQQFILEDIPRVVAQYGTSTAFFGTNCAMQIPMINAVMEQGAIYAMPCCPSPFHGFPSAMGLEVAAADYDDIAHIIAETTRFAAERNMLGRMANWPVPMPMMLTHVGVEYAISWLNNEVSRDSIDMNVLQRLAEQYIFETVGQTIPAYLEPVVESGVTYNNFILLSMGFLVYE